MISYESDEDADTFDDDKLLKAYLGVDPHKPAQCITVVPEPTDWPPMIEQEVGFTVDSTTLAWFKTNHRDWQRQMRFVLRAWTIAQAATVNRLSYQTPASEFNLLEFPKLAACS